MSYPNNDIKALISAALDDGRSFPEIVKIVREEDPNLGLRDAALYCKVVLRLLREDGNSTAGYLLAEIGNFV